MMRALAYPEFNADCVSREVFTITLEEMITVEVGFFLSPVIEITESIGKGPLHLKPKPQCPSLELKIYFSSKRAVEIRHGLKFPCFQKKKTEKKIIVFYQ